MAAQSTRRNLCGVLLLDKPTGITSNAALGWAKRLLNASKAGHTGTLDPFATGLLPICFGEAAKFSQFHLDADKSYRATLKLGQTSSTGDTEGEISVARAINIDADKIAAVLKKFTGAQTQIPPMHSALKQDGVPLYKLARQGIEVERAARHITIHALTQFAWQGDELLIDVTCSKGTYIRVLAEDLGEALGCGAHLIALRRSATGNFSIDDAITIEALEKMELHERESQLLSADKLAMVLPEVTVDSATANALQNGQTPRIQRRLAHFMTYRVYTEAQQFIGITDVKLTDEAGSVLVAKRMMAPPG